MNQLFPSLPSPTITGIIDILAVAVLIYQALLALRGTRAGHIVVGLLLVFGLYGVAVWLGLEALRSLLSFIVPYVGFAIIVLFQSEIRRTLARIGRKRWLTTGYRIQETINDILLAVSELQEKKTGALIVLERDIGLRTFIESGMRIDGRLSRDLLVSMFHPETTLHDGAVIVQKDRIAAAACFLPLSTNPALSLKLGTRHRAAVGITEETDCLSIVVSEETGRISVAAFGELQTGLSLTDLEERIQRHLGVHRQTTVKIDEYAADIPLTHGSSAPIVTEQAQAEQVKKQ